MSYCCHNCGASLDYSNLIKPGRRDECPKCSSDVHCCLNCVNFAENLSNQCRESQIEPVREKDKSNFCDYFALKVGNSSGSSTSSEDVFAQLDDLFKK